MSLFDEPVVTTTPIPMPVKTAEPITAEWLDACRGKRQRDGSYTWNLIPIGGNGDLVFDLRYHEVSAEYLNDDGGVDRVLLMKCDRQAVFVNLLWAMGIPMHFKD